MSSVSSGEGQLSPLALALELRLGPAAHALRVALVGVLQPVAAAADRGGGAEGLEQRAVVHVALDVAGRHALACHDVGEQQRMQ